MKIGEIDLSKGDNLKMEDEFSGLDLDVCKRQLREWLDATNSIFIKGGKVVKLFNSALVLNWYSPVAKEKSSVLKGYFSDMRGALDSMFNKVYKNAVGSIRYLAMKNGESFEAWGENGFSSGGNNFYDLTWIDLEERGPKGTGMNKSRVTTSILPDFCTGMEDVISSLDDLPMDLAVYDEKGNILATYQDLIKTCKEKVAECVENVKNEITSVVGTEVDNITLGVVGAEEKMSA